MTILTAHIYPVPEKRTQDTLTVFIVQILADRDNIFISLVDMSVRALSDVDNDSTIRSSPMPLKAPLRTTWS